MKSATLCAVSLLAAAALVASDTVAEELSPISAASVQSLAEEAASAWAADARLLYVENDSDVGDDGRAERWGYLFWSEQRQASRAYSLRDGEIVLAEDPQVDLPSLPVTHQWIDSGRAVSRANDEGGTSYREKRGGHIENVVLVRGVFHEEHPERATWTVVYTAADAPALWVVIDAESGDLVKKWEG